MKKLLFLATIILTATFAKAQDVVLRNTSCQGVNFRVHADNPGGCGFTYATQVYYLAPGAVMAMSLLPGGPYTPFAWAGPTPPPHSQYTLGVITDPGGMWGVKVGNPNCGYNNNIIVNTNCGTNNAIFDVFNPQLPQIMIN